jgi:hypothetical protein
MIDERYDWARNNYPRIVPVGWFKEAVRATLPGWWWLHETGLKVCCGAVLRDEKRWLHVSMSRRDRMPSYDEMCEVKRLFIGEDTQAIQLFPRKSEHVNLHPNCLHLWACLDGDGLPDFRQHV